ncbi:MAG TPA: hypothetical protein VFJ91_04450 [Gaiellaceae bacterium]|nr:hypothetical protein [Gaiellaceae bacterium]
MDEQDEQRAREPDGWPRPSRDVLRDLERREPLWPEPQSAQQPAAA